MEPVNATLWYMGPPAEQKRGIPPIHAFTANFRSRAHFERAKKEGFRRLPVNGEFFWVKYTECESGRSEPRALQWKDYPDESPKQELAVYIALACIAASVAVLVMLFA
jgi:hypothetical protein